MYPECLREFILFVLPVSFFIKIVPDFNVFIFFILTLLIFYICSNSLFSIYRLSFVLSLLSKTLCVVELYHELLGEVSINLVHLL